MRSLSKERILAEAAYLEATSSYRPPPGLKKACLLVLEDSDRLLEDAV